MATELNNEDKIFQELVLQITDPVLFKVSSNCYEKIMLPSLPTNFGMLMSNIDYPDKSKQNPNGSLFMLPTKEILLDKASDIGIQYFGNELKWNDICNFDTKTVNDSYNSFLNLYYRNSVLNELLFGAGTDDLTNNVNGEDIELETAQRTTLNPGKPFNGSPIDAIDKYITNSIPIVEQLARAIVGKETSDIKKIVKLISDFNTVNGTLITKYLDKNNEVLKQLKNSDALDELKNIRNQAAVSRYVNIIIMGATLNASYANFVKTEIGKKFKDWLDNSMNDIDGEVWNNRKSKFLPYIQVNNKPIKSETDLSKLLESNVTITFGIPKIVDNQNINYSNLLLEDDEPDVNEDARLKLELFNFDEIYNNVQSSIRDVMLTVTMSDPEEWNIVKNAKTRMEKLKEACDKEINAKIELICRTVQNGQSSIGDKFKAAISKHPMRAEGLKNIWARYSDDLTDRIESRVRSIGGMNGNSNIFMSIKRFLIDTYPALIAMMVTWKCVLLLCKEYYNRYPRKTTVNIDIKTATDMTTNKAIYNLLQFIPEDNNPVSNAETSNEPNNEN